MELLLLKEPLTVFQVDNLQEVNLSINPLNICSSAYFTSAHRNSEQRRWLANV